MKGARIYDDGSFEKTGDGIKALDEVAPASSLATIYSIDGKLVKTVKGENLDNVSLDHGMYIVTMKDANGKVKSVKLSK